MKKIIMGFVALLMLSACVYEMEDPSDYAPPAPLESPYAREQLLEMGWTEQELDSLLEAGISFENIVNQGRFSEYAQKINDNQPIGDSGEIILREYFGGIFFNDDGILVVSVLSEAFDDAASFIAIEEMREIGIIIEIVEFSYNDLMGLLNDLNAMIDDIFNENERSSVTGWGIGADNRITVSLHPYNETEIARFRAEIIDSPMIRFVPAFTDEFFQIRLQNITDAIYAAEDRFMVVGEPLVSRTGIAFELINQADRDFFYGLQFDMAVYEDGEWLPIDFVPGYGGFWRQPLFTLHSGETKEYYVDWNWMFGELPPGRYMFIRGGWLQGDDPWEDVIYTLVEFFITEHCPVYLEDLE